MSWRKGTLTIASGQTESEELPLVENGARRMKTFQFFVPDTLTGTVKVYCAPEVGGTYAALNDGFGNDYTLQAGKTQILAGVNAGALKLVSSGAEGADRVFTVYGAAQAM